MVTSGTKGPGPAASCGQPRGRAGGKDTRVIEARELRVDLGGDGVLGIPYVDVTGEAGDGPHLTVIAGVHGTEYTSIAAARELLAGLRPAELSGTVTVAPWP